MHKNSSKYLNDSVNKGDNIYTPSTHVLKSSYLKNVTEYRRMYKESITEPELFWGKIAKSFYWRKLRENDKIDWNFDVNRGPIFTEWFRGAQTNITFNCLDRHILNSRGDRVAYYWEGNDPSDCAQLTYGQLHQQVCQMANLLKSKGLKRGDTVSIYMPMIPELVVAMLACARLGIVHSVIFAGFSANSLSVRFLSAKTKLVITADAFWRGDKLINLKNICDQGIDLAEKEGHSIPTVVWKRHLNPRPGEQGGTARGSRPFKVEITIRERDIMWEDAMANFGTECEPVWMDAEDSLFMLHTSGSTGIPKAIQHTTGGYMLYTSTAYKYCFDYRPGDVFWCTADLGWITGHTFVCYGALLNGATNVMFEGIMTFPDPSRFWRTVDKYKVTQFYTAPTVIRSLMSYDDKYVTESSTRDSLRIIGTAGEPINPVAWEWYYRVVGKSRCAVMDTYWQTETSGPVLTPLPCFATKPGSAVFPFFGIVPAVLDQDGKELRGKSDGYMAIKQAWPGVARNIYGDHERFTKTYFSRFPGYYITGDGVHRDADGYYWITGRIDDMLNVSGHLLSTSEIESIIVEHPSVVEAAAVNTPHHIKGECIYCFVSLHQEEELTPDLETAIRSLVRTKLGGFACPEYIQLAPEMPKTRSGKIIRRILKQIAKGSSEFGDVSSINDYSVIGHLQTGREALFSKMNAD